MELGLASGLRARQGRFGAGDPAVRPRGEVVASLQAEFRASSPTAFELGLGVRTEEGGETLPSC